MPLAAVSQLIGVGLGVYLLLHLLRNDRVSWFGKLVWVGISWLFPFAMLFYVFDQVFADTGFAHDDLDLAAA